MNEKIAVTGYSIDDIVNLYKSTVGFTSVN